MKKKPVSNNKGTSKPPAIKKIGNGMIQKGVGKLIERNKKQADMLKQLGF